MGFEVYLATGGGIRMGENDPDAEQNSRDLWEDETQREVVVDCLKADCEVKSGEASGSLLRDWL